MQLPSKYNGLIAKKCVSIILIWVVMLGHFNKFKTLTMR